MRRPTNITLPDRRYIVIGLVALAAVAALAAATVITPPSRTSSETGGTTGTAGTSTTTVEGDRSKGPVTSTVEPLGDSSTDAEGRTAPAAGASDALSKDAATGATSNADTAEVSGDTVMSSPLDQPALDARIVRTGSIVLRAKRGHFEDVWSDAQRTATLYGGYVLDASRSGTDSGPRSGSLTLRIPSARFDTAVDHVRGLSDVKVRQLDISSQDVSQEYVDVQSRLRHDRAVEARLVALLAKAKTVSEVLAVQSRLDTVQAGIEQSKGRLDYLSKMTAMSTIELSISEPGAAAKPHETKEPSALTTAWRDARERFTGNVAAAIVWTGGALPVLALFALIALAARLAWTRVAGRPTSRPVAAAAPTSAGLVGTPDAE